LLRIAKDPPLINYMHYSVCHLRIISKGRPDQSKQESHFTELNDNEQTVRNQIYSKPNTHAYNHRALTLGTNPIGLPSISIGVEIYSWLVWYQSNRPSINFHSSSQAYAHTRPSLSIALVRTQNYPFLSQEKELTLGAIVPSHLFHALSQTRLQSFPLIFNYYILDY
jgi:hypothetical protein